MNSTNKLTGKEIAVVIAALIIGVAGVACMAYGITLINDQNDLKSATDIEKLKADAMTDYREQMQKYSQNTDYVHMQGAAGQSITQTPDYVHMQGAAGQSITETADEIILVGAAGQTMVIKK